jgi:L-malate glycosyltransferase
LKIALLSDGGNVHTRRWLEYFQDQGDQTLLITLEEPVEIPGEVSLLRGPLPVRFLNYNLAVPAAARALSRFKPDLINAHFVPNYGWMALRLGISPWVISTWGSDILVNARVSPLHRWRARRVLRGADLVTSDAMMLSDAVKKLAGEDLNLLTVPMGIDRALFDDGDGRHRREKVILHNRNLENVYDLPTVLHGLAGFFKMFPDWRARLAGDGSLRGELMEMSRTLGIDQKVEFLGRLPREQLMTELKGAQIYLSASLSDSTSVSLLEAMALGVYPVLSDIVANREWIPGAPWAQFFTPGQPDGLAKALFEALAMPQSSRQSALKDNRSKIADGAIWENNMARVRRSYLELLEQRS